MVDCYFDTAFNHAKILSERVVDLTMAMVAVGDLALVDGLLVSYWLKLQYLYKQLFCSVDART